MKSKGKNDKENKIQINKIIKTLLEAKTDDKQFILGEHQIIALCYHAKNIMMIQPMLLELNPPLNICGDFHGQFEDLKEMFKTIGYPQSGQNYLFLGDYVDRGKQSLQCICLLFALKIKHPGTFFLLRGNHECSELNKIYGFYDECKRKIGIKLWKIFCDCFNCFPVAAVVGNRIFCIHGGLSPYLSNLEYINNIKRPYQFQKGSIVADLLWADPSEQEGWTQNIERGTSYCFGPDIIKQFLKKHDFDLICRSHQIVEDGFQFFANKGLITIFSAPNYCTIYHNKGAVLVINEEMACKIKQFCKEIIYKYKIPRSSTPSLFQIDQKSSKNFKKRQRKTFTCHITNSILKNLENKEI